MASLSFDTATRVQRTPPGPATPHVRIDQSRLVANLRRLADYAAEHGIGLRPHAKTHKSTHVARLQLEHGALGLTAAKLSEAETLAGVCDDLLLAYPIADFARAENAARLANRVRLTVAFDSAACAELLSEAARAAGSTIGVLVDLDVGLHRTGVQTPAAAAELMQTVDALPGLELSGLFCYPGHIWAARDRQAEPLREVADRLRETIDLANRRGLNVETVSGGSTPTAYQSHLVPQLTEIRPGTYPFNDMNTVRGGYCEVADCAAAVIVTVVSDAVPDQVVIDAGSKTLTSDRCVPAPESGHGHVLEYPQAIINKLSEEHGQVDIRACPVKPSVGERLTVIPNHICPCINLQDTVWLTGADGKRHELAVDARGKLC